MEIAAEIDKTKRRSEAKSWLVVLVLAAAISGALYGAAKLAARHLSGLYHWFDRWVEWDDAGLVPVAVLILALTVLLAAVVAHGLRWKKIERRAVTLGPWVLYLPAFVGSFFAIGGISYLMWLPCAGGGLISTLVWLLIRNDNWAATDWRLWIAVGRVGRGAIERPDSGDWQIAPLLIVAIGIAMTILGLVQVFRAHREKRLQTDGLYATVRHPQHLGIAIWTFGLALAASTTAAYMTWFTMLYCYLLLAHWEEKRLSQQLGSIYDDYRRRTPFRFLSSTKVCHYPSLGGPESPLSPDTMCSGWQSCA